MNDQQLFINDIEIDLNPNEVVAITSQINNIAEIKNQQSSLTNRFKVPKTKNNIAALEAVDQVASGSYMPYRKNRAKIIKAGTPVIPNGFAVIESASEVYYITVYSGNADFFDSIEGKLLSELDLAGHDVEWSVISAYNTFAFTTGAKFSIVDYGYFDNSTRLVDCQEQRVSTFVHTVVDQIFSDAGFTYDSDFLSSNAFYKKLILPFTNDTIKHSQAWMSGRRFSAIIPAYNIVSIPFVSYSAGISSTTVDNSGMITTGSWTSGVPAFGLAIDEKTKWKFTLTVTFTVNSWTAASSQFQIRFLNSSNIPYEHTDDQGAGTFTFTITDDVEYLNPSGTPLAQAIFEVSNADVDIDSCTWDGIPDVDTYYGSTWNVASNLPEKMKQKDFLKAILQMFGLICDTNYITKTVRIKQFKEIVEAIPNARDWGDLLHMSKTDIDVSYRIGNYSQVNNFTYKEDSDDEEIEDDLGNGSITVNDETLPKSQNAVALPFAATHMVKKLINLDCPLIKKVDDDTGEFTYKVLPRILIDDTQDIVGDDLTYTDGTTTYTTKVDIPLCYFILSSKTNNLGFNNSILNDHYLPLTNVLNKAKVVNAKFKLPTTTFYNFDHFIPVYLPQFGSYFYVNRLPNFLGDGLNKAELIRIGSQDESLINVCFNEFYAGEQFSLAGWTYGVNWLYLAPQLLFDSTGAGSAVDTVTYPTYTRLKPGKCYKLIIDYEITGDDINVVTSINGGQYLFTNTFGTNTSAVVMIGQFNITTLNGTFLKISVDVPSGSSIIYFNSIKIVSCDCTDFD